MKVFVHTILNLMVKISSKLHEENYSKIKKNLAKNMVLYEIYRNIYKIE